MDRKPEKNGGQPDPVCNKAHVSSVCDHTQQHDVRQTNSAGRTMPSRTVASFRTACCTIWKDSVLEDPGGPTMMSGIFNWMQAMIANTFS
jgi:hypothetical protein